MPPAAKRNASVILFDVNTTPEFLERSQKCLLNICATKWFRKSNDCTKLILLNTAETKNTFADKFGKCPHITEATDVINYDPKLIEPHLKDVETAKGDWLIGLIVALEAIRNNYYDCKGVMSLQLLFITDFSCMIKLKEKLTPFIIKQLNLMEVYLYILGPEVRFPKVMATHSDIREWSDNVILLGALSENTNLSVAREIVSKSKGIMCDLKIGEELFHAYANRWGLQPWKVPLTIGSRLSMSCSTVRFLRKENGPRIKPIIEEGYQDPWKWHLAEDVNVEVPYDNVIGGVFKHNTFVPLPSDVEKNFKVIGERMLKIVGFTKMSNIPEFYMQGSGASYVENDGSKLFDLLLNTLAEQDKCAIAIRVYMKNTRPKLVVLLPHITDRVFIMVEIPYKEAVNGSFKLQDVNEAVKLDKTQDPSIDAAYNYLNQLDITCPNNTDHNKSVKWPLSGVLMNDLRLNCVSVRCLKKYLDPEAEITLEPEITLPCFVDDAQTLKQFIPAQEPEI